MVCVHACVLWLHALTAFSTAQACAGRRKSLGQMHFNSMLIGGFFLAWGVHDEQGQRQGGLTEHLRCIKQVSWSDEGAVLVTTVCIADWHALGIVILSTSQTAMSPGNE